MKCLEMTIYANRKNLTEKDQLNFVHKFYTYESDGIEEKPKLGILEKFSSSLGFKNLDWHYGEQHTYIEKVEESPQGYLTPYTMLMFNMYFLNKKNEYISFILEDKEVKHTKDKYSYNTFDMLIKFQQFLYKVYGRHIRIEFSFRDNAKLGLKEWLFSHFYTTVAQGELYETECSLPRMLTKREKKYVIENIKRYISYKPVLNQYYCETCASHHKETPYHTELLDKEVEERWERESIENGSYLRDYV